MCSLLRFTLCCFVLGTLHEAYFICKTLERPSGKQPLQALSSALRLNFTDNFEAIRTNGPNPPCQPSASPRAQGRSERSPTAPEPSRTLHCCITYKLTPRGFSQTSTSLSQKVLLTIPPSPNTPYLFQITDFFFFLVKFFGFF